MRARAGRPRPAARKTVSPEVCPYRSRTKEVAPTWHAGIACPPKKERLPDPHLTAVIYPKKIFNQ